jgi:transposase
MRAMQTRIVPGSAAGESIRTLAERLQVTERTVCLWRGRYASHGLDGLRNRPRPDILAGSPRPRNEQW